MYITFSEKVKGPITSLKALGQMPSSHRKESEHGSLLFLVPDNRTTGMVRLVRSTQVLLAVLCFISLFLYLMFYLPTRSISTTPNAQARIITESYASVEQKTVSALLNVTSEDTITTHNDSRSQMYPGVQPSQQFEPVSGNAPITTSVSSTAANLSIPKTSKILETPSSTTVGKVSKSVIQQIPPKKIIPKTTTYASDKTIKGVKASTIYEAGHFLSNPELCPNLGTDLNLLALVMSAPNHFTARQAIRQTWGHYRMQRDVSIAFLLGSTNNDLKIEADLKVEQQLYGDLIRGKFLDSYNNLTLKTISMLEWVDNYCSKTKFVLKTDDDMFINVQKLLNFITQYSAPPCKKVIYGRLAKKWKPIRNTKSKYYVSLQQYRSPVFPDFVTGPAYLISNCAIHDLHVNALNNTYLKLEDVFTTGIVAEKIGVKRIHAHEFLNKRIPFNPCNVQKSISIHMVKYSEQFDLWKKLLDGKSKCK